MSLRNATPGTQLYRIGFESGRGHTLYKAWFVHRKGGGWYRFRNISTGEEWNEQGDRGWQTSKAHAFWYAAVMIMFRFERLVCGKTRDADAEQDCYDKMWSLMNLALHLGVTNDSPQRR